jgi:hypothetical protein
VKISIIGCESRGVRGLSCFIETKDRKFLIDPGLALGYIRRKLHPHPFQIAIGNNIRMRLIKAFKCATDIVISHYHGDHVPLLKPNPFQLGFHHLEGIWNQKRWWVRGSDFLTKTMHQRRNDLKSKVDINFRSAEGYKHPDFAFSHPIPHGTHSAKIMMTKITDKEDIFVHASDFQLLNTKTTEVILQWKPTILVSSGPAFYLQRLSRNQLDTAWMNALKLVQNIPLVILDHHLCRNEKGLEYIRKLNKFSTGQVMCGAEFMNEEPMLLEAWRSTLYKEMPVDNDWQESYLAGNVNLEPYQHWRKWKC